MLKRFGCPIPIEMVRVKYLNNLVEQDHRFIKRRVQAHSRLQDLHLGSINHCRRRAGKHDPQGPVQARTASVSAVLSAGRLNLITIADPTCPIQWFATEPAAGQTAAPFEVCLAVDELGNPGTGLQGVGGACRVAGRTGSQRSLSREAQTFLRLTPDMAARVAAYGTEERLPAGTTVFERGERSVDFFLVLDGNIEIFDLDERGRPNVFTVH